MHTRTGYGDNTTKESNVFKVKEISAVDKTSQRVVTMHTSSAPGMHSYLHVILPHVNTPLSLSTATTIASAWPTSRIISSVARIFDELNGTTLHCSSIDYYQCYSTSL